MFQRQSQTLKWVKKACWGPPTQVIAGLNAQVGQNMLGTTTARLYAGLNAQVDQTCWNHQGTQPPAVARKNESSVGIFAHCIRVFARLVSICMLCRRLSTKISASELSRKLIKSALLVGQEVYLYYFLPMTKP